LQVQNLKIAESSEGVARVPRGSGIPLPIKMLSQVFKLNFSWDVPKKHYFSNKFSKIAKRWRQRALKFSSLPPAPLSLQFWWAEVT